MPIVLVVIMILLFPVFLQFLNQYSGNAASAPIFLKRMEVYQRLKQSVRSCTTTEEAVKAFSEMCRMEVSCLSDMILVESHGFPESDQFNIHFARQFEFPGYPEFIQLHMDLNYPLSQLDHAPDGFKWYDNDLVDLQKAMKYCPPVQEVQDISPIEIRVFIDRTWS